MFGHVGEGAAGGELTPPVVVLTVDASAAGERVAPSEQSFRRHERRHLLAVQLLPPALVDASFNNL